MADVELCPLTVAPAKAQWPQEKHLLRSRRWAHPATASVMASVKLAVPEWEPATSAIIAVRDFHRSDVMEEQVTALSASYRGLSTAELTAVLYEQIADFSYLKSLPSLLGQQVAQLLGGASSSCAVTTGWDSATALAFRMIKTGECKKVLLVGHDESGVGYAQLCTTAESLIERKTAQVYLAGVGAVTAIGNTFTQTSQKLLAGTVGVYAEPWLELIPVTPAAARIPTEVTKSLVKKWTEQTRRKLSASEALALEVATQAVGDKAVVGRRGLVFAEMWAGQRGADPKIWASCFSGNPEADNSEPELTNLGSDLSQLWGCPVVTLGVEATCAGGIRALAEAVRMVETGEVDEAIAVSVVARTNPLLVSQFAQLTALAHGKVEPRHASRPFAASRSGMVIGEAAVAIYVSKEKSCDGVRIHATGLALDPDHPTAPKKEFIQKAVLAAVEQTGLSLDQMGTVNAHGTGTKLNDEVEAEAFNKLFQGRKVPITACKSMTGHASAASSLLEVAVLANTLLTGDLPGVPTCDDLDEALDIDISTQSRQINAKAGVSTSFGFGGQYAAIVLGKDS